MLRSGAAQRARPQPRQTEAGNCAPKASCRRSSTAPRAGARTGAAAPGCRNVASRWRPAGRGIRAAAGGGAGGETRGSQAGHSLTPGAISRPHSGQIQWNMASMYTDRPCLAVSDTPYTGIGGSLICSTILPRASGMSSEGRSAPEISVPGGGSGAWDLATAPRQTPGIPG